MAVNLSPLGGVGAQFFDSNGVPLAGGLIYTYSAGTNTPQATYTSASGIIQHSNPIVLDAAGRVPTGEIWLTDGVAYKFVIQTSAAVLVGTYDNIVGINSNFVAYTAQQEIQIATAGQTVFNLTTMQYQPATNNLSVFVDGVNQYGPGAQYAFIETDSDTVTFVSGLHVGASVKFTTATPVASAVVNAENVAYDPPFFGSIGTNVEAKLSEIVSVKDFGAVGDGITDDTTAIQNALDSGAAAIYFPTGEYNVTAPLSVSSNTKVYGDGIGSRVFTTATTNSVYSWGNTGLVIFVLDQVDNVYIQDLWIDTSGITSFTFASRSIVAYGCSYIWVQNCKFVTCGAATAFLNCAHYWISQNDIYVNPTDSDSHHDGIIDQWWGNNDFTIDGNVIRSVAPAAMQYAILVTGTETDGTTPAACRRFSITNNKIYNCEIIGIRSQGETGNNYDCVIANNIVDTVTTYFGISVENTINAVVSGNAVYTTYYSGIKVSGSGSGSSNVSIVGNSLYNTVTSSSASDSNSAISCQEVTRSIVSGNTIAGSTHPRAVHFSSASANGRELANQYGEATKLPAVQSDSATSVVSFGEYTMTKTAVTNVSSVSYGDSNYSVSGNVVTVSFKVAPVASGAGACVVRLSLPYASNLTLETDLIGSCATGGGQSGALYGDTTNNAALLSFTASGAGTYVFFGTFQYTIK